MATEQERPAARTTAPTPPTMPLSAPPVVSPRRRSSIAAVPSAPHTRPGDQNALCIETDQA